MMIQNRLYKTIRSLEPIIEFMKLKDYSINNNFNIINIRSSERNSGNFDDLQIVFWRNKKEDRYEFIKYVVTTDPSTFYLKNPLNRNGTAVVFPTQYKKLWTLGKHRNKYEALVQNTEIYVVRDNNKDEYIDIDFDDFDRKEILKALKVFTRITMNTIKGEKVDIERGHFGINCHRASEYRLLKKIGRYSAGCCVHNDIKGFNTLINLVKVKTNYPMDVTYIDEIEFNKFLFNK